MSSCESSFFFSIEAYALIVIKTFSWINEHWALTNQCVATHGQINDESYRNCPKEIAIADGNLHEKKLILNWFSWMNTTMCNVESHTNHQGN